MRVQPLCPSSPFTAITIFRRGSRSWACSAASSPAPPAPRIRMSVSSCSSIKELQIPERLDPPIRPDHPGERQNHRARACRGSPDPAVVENDIPQSVQSMIERHEEEGDIYGLPVGIRDAVQDGLVGQLAAPQGRRHEVFHPEVGGEKNQQQRARDALEVPFDGAAKHVQIFSTDERKIGMAPARNTTAPTPSENAQKSCRWRSCPMPRSISVIRTPLRACRITVPSSAISSSLNTGCRKNAIAALN